MGNYSKQDNTCAPKDGSLSRAEKPMKSNTPKQAQSHKKDKEEFEKRRDIWLKETDVPPTKRNTIISDVAELRSLRKIDITLANTITSFFLTHKAEHVGWRIAAALAETLFVDKVSLERLHKMLAWKFDYKYPATQQLYTSKLLLADLEDVRKKYKSRDFQKTIANYKLGPARLLPDNLEHRKALVASSTAPTAHTFGFGQSSPYSLPKPQVSSPLSSIASSPFSQDTIQVSAPAGSSTPSITQAPGLNTPPPSPSVARIKRERSLDNTLSGPATKKHFSDGTKEHHDRLNKEYVSRQAQLIAQRAEKQAHIDQQRELLDNHEAAMAAWFAAQTRQLETEDSQRRTAGSGL